MIDRISVPNFQFLVKKFTIDRKANSLFTYHSVSYTHLDVYKRQNKLMGTNLIVAFTEKIKYKTTEVSQIARIKTKYLGSV